jgi:NADH:ubiquinone reductase (H+-translocating)
MNASRDLAPHSELHLIVIVGSGAGGLELASRLGDKFEMNGLDRVRQEVRGAPFTDEDGDQGTPQRVLRYDTLMISVGSLTDDFDTPGVKKNAICLEAPAEAASFHRCLVTAYIRAHAQPEALRPQQLKVAIIGAGATGVELAAELHKSTRELLRAMQDPRLPGRHAPATSPSTTTD